MMTSKSAETKNLTLVRKLKKLGRPKTKGQDEEEKKAGGVSGKKKRKSKIPVAKEITQDHINKFTAGKKMKANRADFKMDNSKTDSNEKSGAREKMLNNKLQIKTVDQLLLHNTDTSVKPIIGKEVEELPELEYKYVLTLHHHMGSKGDPLEAYSIELII